VLSRLRLDHRSALRVGWGWLGRPTGSRRSTPHWRHRHPLQRIRVRSPPTTVIERRSNRRTRRRSGTDPVPFRHAGALPVYNNSGAGNPAKTGPTDDTRRVRGFGFTSIKSAIRETFASGSPSVIEVSGQGAAARPSRRTTATTSGSSSPTASSRPYSASSPQPIRRRLGLLRHCSRSLPRRSDPGVVVAYIASGNDFRCPIVADPAAAHLRRSGSPGHSGRPNRDHELKTSATGQDRHHRWNGAVATSAEDELKKLSRRRQ
jgi:hypothetical protein